jgi:alkylation response protein AidB-like acyl-CoA dehydrogenase
MGEDVAELRARVRAWIEKHHPGVPDFPLPTNAIAVSEDRQLEWLRAWQEKVYAAGFVGAEWPVEYGGGGQPRGTQSVIDQELARAGAPFLVNLVGLSWAGPIILQAGTEAQKRRHAKRILSCEDIWCQGFSEPGAGSDLAGLRASARRDGDDWVIDGHKVWTSLGRYADWCILLARTDPSAPRHAGISYFLAPMRVPGVEVRPLVKMTGEGGFNQVIFSEARIPGDTLLGKLGQGWALAMATLQFERGAAEGSAGGSGFGAGDRVAELVALAREVRRDGACAFDDPVVRDRIAGFAIREAAARYGAQRARIPGLVVDRPEALPLMQKVVTTELLQEIAEFGCELVGTRAGLWLGDPLAPDDAAWPHAYMSSFAGTIAGGTSEILRNVLGERVLRLPKSR